LHAIDDNLINGFNILRNQFDNWAERGFFLAFAIQADNHSHGHSPLGIHRFVAESIGMGLQAGQVFRALNQA
jgi:hypothetical protein